MFGPDCLCCCRTGHLDYGSSGGRLSGGGGEIHSHGWGRGSVGRAGAAGIAGGGEGGGGAPHSYGGEWWGGENGGEPGCCASRHFWRPPTVAHGWAPLGDRCGRDSWTALGGAGRARYAARAWSARAVTMGLQPAPNPSALARASIRLWSKTSREPRLGRPPSVSRRSGGSSRPATPRSPSVCKATYLLQVGESPLAPDPDAPNEEDNHWDDDPGRSLVRGLRPRPLQGPPGGRARRARLLPAPAPGALHLRAARRGLGRQVRRGARRPLVDHLRRAPGGPPLREDAPLLRAGRGRPRHLEPGGHALRRAGWPGCGRHPQPPAPLVSWSGARRTASSPSASAPSRRRGRRAWTGSGGTARAGHPMGGPRGRSRGISTLLTSTWRLPTSSLMSSGPTSG